MATNVRTILMNFRDVQQEIAALREHAAKKKREADQLEAALTKKIGERESILQELGEAALDFADMTDRLLTQKGKPTNES